jgi:hypothetical protein
MAPSESEGDEIDDLEFENGTSDAEGDEEEADEEVLEALDNDPDDATEGDDVCSVRSFLRLLILYRFVYSLRNRFLRTQKKARTRRMMMTPNALERTLIWT